MGDRDPTSAARNRETENGRLDPVVPRSSSVAARHGSRDGMLQRNEDISERRGVRIDQPDTQSIRGDSSQHRRGSRTRVEERVSSVPTDSASQSPRIGDSYAPVSASRPDDRTSGVSPIRQVGPIGTHASDVAKSPSSIPVADDLPAGSVPQFPPPNSRLPAGSRSLGGKSEEMSFLPPTPTPQFPSPDFLIPPGRSAVCAGLPIARVDRAPRGLARLDIRRRCRLRPCSR